MERASWRYRFSHPLADVWPYISNTDKMNRAVGLSDIVYRHEPDLRGGSKRLGSYGKGLEHSEWEELPYEWVKEQYFEVLRIYSQGPLSKMHNTCRVVESDEKGFTIEQVFEYQPSRWYFTWPVRRAFNKGLRKSFLRAYARIDAFLSEVDKFKDQDKLLPSAFAPIAKDLTAHDANKVRAVKEKLNRAKLEPDFISRLMTFLFESQETELVRVRPFVLAREWQQTSKDILVSMLRATEAGVFNLSWDLLCPNCRGAKTRNETLGDLKATVHCESCNIDFDADFSKSVELSFRVHPSVRAIQVADYCVGGPQNTPHCLAQVLISSAHKKTVKMDLRMGTYRVRSPHSKKTVRLEVGMEGTNAPFSLHWPKADSEKVPEEELFCAQPGSVEIEFSTDDPEPMLIILENAQWITDACTAAHVTALQEFRDLFSTEVLKAGLEISIQAMALMFTDLKGSTALYNRIGSAKAFSVVSEHFEVMLECVRRNSGALVKNIGDAIMASFIRPEDAVKAAIEIHRTIEAKNLEWGERGPLRLKIGIHFGPCLAVNLNDRLDYFGSSVNIAARTEGQCEGGDIVISKQTYSDPGVQSVLKSEGLKVEEIVRAIKGFDRTMELCQIRVLP
jgi:class 3 adenylate cyclase